MGLEPMSGFLLFAAYIFKVDSNHTVPNKPESNGILANNIVVGEAGFEPATNRSGIYPSPTILPTELFSHLPQRHSEGLFRDATAPDIYDFVFDTTASTKFHLSFDKEEELS